MHIYPFTNCLRPDAHPPMSSCFAAAALDKVRKAAPAKHDRHWVDRNDHYRLSTHCGLLPYSRVLATYCLITRTPCSCRRLGPLAVPSNDRPQSVTLRLIVTLQCIKIPSHTCTRVHKR